MWFLYVHIQLNDHIKTVKIDEWNTALLTIGSPEQVNYQKFTSVKHFSLLTYTIVSQPNLHITVNSQSI